MPHISASGLIALCCISPFLLITVLLLIVLLAWQIWQFDYGVDMDEKKLMCGIILFLGLFALFLGIGIYLLTASSIVGCVSIAIVGLLIIESNLRLILEVFQSEDIAV